MMKKLMMLWLLLFALPGFAGHTALGRDGIQSVLLSPGGVHVALLTRAGDVDQPSLAIEVLNCKPKSIRFTLIYATKRCDDSQRRANGSKKRFVFRAYKKVQPMLAV